MERYTEVEGDLISMALQGYFDVITQGNNCFNTMGAGIAPQMAKAFGCDKYRLEHPELLGDINKLGQICYGSFYTKEGEETLCYLVNKTNNRLEEEGYKKNYCVNSYTQYDFGFKNGIPLDYEALTLCLRKINKVFKGKHIGLPQIGAGLAGGDWEKIKQIIQTELKDCTTTVVIYNKK